MIKEVFIAFLLLCGNIWSSTICFADYQSYDKCYTLSEAYSLKDYDKIQDLVLRVDKTFIFYYENRKKLINVSDFKNLRSLKIITDFNEIWSNTTYTTSDESVEAMNEWISTSGQLKNQLTLTITSDLQIKKIDNVKNLNVYYKNFVAPGIFDLKGIENLNLMNMYDTSFNFMQFKDLKHLNIHLTGDQKFNFNNISSCENLKILNLTLDNLTSIDLSVFPKGIEQIDLGLNEFTEFDLRTVSRFNELKKIRIRSNKIKSVDFKELSNNKELSKVILEMDSLKTIQFLQTADSSITSIEIHSKAITTIPTGFNNFSQIQSLILNAPLLCSISNDFYLANTLKYLNIESSSLLEIPEELSNLKNLEQVVLSLNQIKGVYKIFKELPKLDYVEIKKSINSNDKTKSKRTNIARFKSWRLQKMFPNAFIHIHKYYEM
jgi:hypothetical protein